MGAWVDLYKSQKKLVDLNTPAFYIFFMHYTWRIKLKKYLVILAT